jgi:hypothetical protein
MSFGEPLGSFKVYGFGVTDGEPHQPIVFPKFAYAFLTGLAFSQPNANATTSAVTPNESGRRTDRDISATFDQQAESRYIAVPNSGLIKISVPGLVLSKSDIRNGMPFAAGNDFIPWPII